MILDTLDGQARYRSLHPRFARAFDWLRTCRMEELPDGRQEIDGSALYATISRETGRGQAAAKYEAHRNYIDIQYLAAGSELIGWSHLVPELGSLGYEPARDLEFFGKKPTLWVPVPTGHFAIFFPEDAHAPLAGTGCMLKVVVKVAV